MRTYLATLLLATACYGTVQDGNPPPGTPPETTPPPTEPPPPTPAVYKRGSLVPLYHLTPREEYGRFEHNGVNMNDADFEAVGSGFVSSAQKMDEISAQISTERGTTVNVISDASDRTRAQQIPFRGNPSDVKIVSSGAREILAVPLGGDLMTPGNEVALVDASTRAVTRVKVGIRPQRLAVADNLVFVCNQYSNYITIVDALQGDLLRTGAGPVEIQTEYNCTDLLLVQRDPIAHDPDKLALYVANGWRASVLEYDVDIVRDAISNRAVDVRAQPGVEISGVGTNPWRLSLGESQDTLYVANSRGGELSRIRLSDQSITRVALGAPAIDAVQIDDALYVPTTMKDRGLLSNDEATLPSNVQSPPISVTGLDGASHQAHPGALFDDSRSYNFEDVRDGLFQISSNLNNPGSALYYTDDVSSEPNYVSQQKIIAGGLPIAIVRNTAGTKLFVAESGSAQVQELDVGTGSFRLTKGARVFHTRERPFALALDEAANKLWVADWGGEVLEGFDLGSGARTDQIDLGYAATRYPATDMERGEELFYDTSWSNNGRKACASCHVDELLEDGIGFSNGATAPTAYHQVTPNFNQMTTDSYFWNGSFANGSYTSLALAAQTRTNCELILFGLIEGISSDPNARIGDPNNRVTDGNDARCRPQAVGADGLPQNFNTIKQTIASQKVVAGQVIQSATGLDRETVFRLVDFYSVSELRLPPNPLAYLKQAGQLDSATSAKIDQGAQLFQTAGCAGCHDPTNTRHPFTDGLNHGEGADYAQRFVDTYSTDPRITNAINGGIPQAMLEAIAPSTAGHEINVHVTPIDYFVPFCFNGQSCLQFDDPLLVRGNNTAETDRLNVMIAFNLGDPDRGFIPGNVPGEPAANTPSLRGTWWKANFLHHGHARSVAEAILAPGHPALRTGENGWAIDALGDIDVHGTTSTMTQDQVDALVLYVSSIE